MNRRHFLSVASTTTLAALAGCAESGIPSGSGNGSNNQDTTEEQNHKAPMPGRGDVSDIPTLTKQHDGNPGTLGLKISEAQFPRPVTLEIYKQVPTSQNPPTIEQHNTFTFSNTPYGEKVAERVISQPAHGEWREGLQKYDPREEPFTVAIKNPQPEQGVGFQYRIDLVEHTIENKPRRTLATTSQLLLPPWTHTEFVNGNKREFSRDDLQHARTYLEDKDVSRHRVICSTYRGRWQTPGNDNRPLGYGGGEDGHTLGDYEYLFAFEYKLDSETTRKLREQNRQNYWGNINNGGDDRSNTTRHMKHNLQHPRVDKMAKKLDDIASQFGFTGPGERLRLVCDFIQNMEYYYDSDLPTTLPYVQHPVNVFAVGGGDCEDFTLAAAALLSTDTFDFSPVAIDVKPTGVAKTYHVGIGIPTDEVPNAMDSFSSPPLTHTQDGTEYLYCDVTEPCPIGWLPDAYEPDEILA